MKGRYKQLSLLIFAAICTGLSLLTLQSEAVMGAMAGAFLAAASAYTALDLRAVVKASGELPKGQYQSANMWKYWVAMGLLSLLFLLAIIRQERDDLSLELAIGFFGPGVVGIVAIMIAGIKVNKAATVKDGKKITHQEIKEGNC